jgi:hypothetical protein
MRVRTRDGRVDESRALTGPDALDRLLALGAHLEVVAPVDLVDGEAAEAADELGHRRRMLVVGGDGDGIAVVGDDIEDGQVQGARGVERLPELALRHGALAE